jgi:hypothetical protein
MIIRVKKTWKDFVEKDPNHPTLTRRDFIERGLLTGAMSVAVPSILMKSALGDVVCPPQVRNGGGLAQWYSDGGATHYNFIYSTTTANVVTSSATAATNYGVVPTDLVAVGAGASGGNFILSSSSPFGATVIAGHPGYTPAQWAQVLKNCSVGHIHGPWVQDDGGMPDNVKTGAALGKSSLTNKDLRSGDTTPISWAAGVPSSTVSSLTTANLAKTFGITPAGLINTQTMSNTATAAQNLSALFGGMFGLAGRKGANNITTNATCGFMGDAPLTDPNYGINLFTPANIPALASKTAGLTATELAMLAAYFRSADGSTGGVVIRKGGFDYHGQTATTIGNQDILAARALVMFLAACDSAGQKGAFIMNSNGSAIAAGSTPGTTLTVNGTAANGGTTGGTITSTVQAAAGDAGGYNNKGVVILYSPAGTPPVTKEIGTINPSTGSATAASAASTVLDGLSGLYLTAALWLGNSAVNYTKLQTAIQKAGGGTTANILI